MKITPRRLVLVFVVGGLEDHGAFMLPLVEVLARAQEDFVRGFLDGAAFAYARSFNVRHVRLRSAGEVRALLELFETASAIDAGGGEQVRLCDDEARRRVFVRVEVLHHYAVLAERNVDQLDRPTR